MSALLCPNGHQLRDEDTDVCSSCGEKLVPESAVIDVYKQTREVWLAYEVAVLDAAEALPDLAIHPAAGEGPLSAVALTSPDHLERLVVLVGDDQARVLIEGLVARHTPRLVVPDSLPPGLRG